MYEALEGKPMTVRYLDPPLHEFVPTDPEDIKALAEDMGLTRRAGYRLDAMSFTSSTP